MKLTKARLQQIIKEEIGLLKQEAEREKRRQEKAEKAERAKPEEEDADEGSDEPRWWPSPDWRRASRRRRDRWMRRKR